MQSILTEQHIDDYLCLIDKALPQQIQGRVCGLTGLTVEVEEFPSPVGSQCEIQTRSGQVAAAELIGFRGDVSVLMPLADMGGISRGDWVRCVNARPLVPVGLQLLGRVIDGTGNPIDGKGPLLCPVRRPVQAQALGALKREPIDTVLSTGVRALDAMMTCGCGQRMGIFSGPGVGKSILLGMIARYTSADVNVIALVGERGREVRQFIERDLGPDGLSRSVVVVSTSNEPAPVRVRAGLLATTIAEYFRDHGSHVLMLMDSITRIAMAQRQIGLAMGESPATRGYTPTVFALLPSLLERCGRGACGSITGFYTVLVEGDDLSEPVSDAMRGILDGHIWLARNLANRGQYPAVDVLESISRVMPDIVDDEHLRASRELTHLTAVYRDIEDLVNIGAYSAGTNPEYDRAVKAYPQINSFLRQDMREPSSWNDTLARLKELSGKWIAESPGKASARANGKPQSTGKPVGAR